MALWFARYLTPFDTVEKPGFVSFFSKTFPQFKLPTEATLRNSALRDVYQTLHEQLVDDIKDAPSMCIMFDGWTDRHKARGYLGLRATYITDSWAYRLVTLSYKVLHSHTADAIANHVKEELSGLVDTKKIQLFSAHDGASAMKKTSRLLRVEAMTHCAAQALNLLLMSDGIEKVEEACSLIAKSKEIVNTLHFKGK